jgi:hypothetical protein
VSHLWIGEDVDVAIWPNDILDLRFVRIARP